MAPSRGQDTALRHVGQTSGGSYTRVDDMMNYCRRNFPPTLLLFTCCVILVVYLYETPLPRGPPFQVDSATLRFHSSPGAPPRGRSKHNGTWAALGSPRQLFAYSAFFDDRRSLGTLPVVRVIATVEEGSPHVHCMLWYSDDPAPFVVKGDLLAIGVGVSRNAGQFKEYVVTCPLDNEKVPVNVSLAYDVTPTPAFKLPVEIPTRMDRRGDFVVCVSVAYWRHEPQAIVEWLELLRLLGAELVTIYNNSLTAAAARVFQYYDSTGFVDLRQSHSFLRQGGELTIHMHMSPVINDCMYRNMYRYKKVIVTDLDELIIPRGQDTYGALLAAVDRQVGGRHPARQYTFRNAYFFTDIFGHDKNQSQFLKTLRYRHRLPASEPGYAVKSIVDPLSCTNMHNHACWGLTRLYDRPGHTVYVESDVALNQHYKSCHFDSYETPGKCAEAAKSAVEDNSMLRFREPLIRAVQPVFKALGLEPL